MPTVSVNLDPQLHQRLTRLAAQRGTTSAALLRAAVVAYTQIPPPSVVDLAGDLVGSLDAPHDLSHGAHHLAGYGQ